MENTDCQGNLAVVPSEISIMVTIHLPLLSNAILGTNIKTNEEVAIKLVNLIFSHKPFLTPFFLGTSKNQASPIVVRD